MRNRHRGSGLACVRGMNSLALQGWVLRCCGACSPGQAWGGVSGWRSSGWGHGQGCLADLLFQSAGAAGRSVWVRPGHLPFVRSLSTAAAARLIRRHCGAFSLCLEGTAGLGGLSAAFIHHGPVTALQAVSC